MKWLDDLVTYFGTWRRERGDNRRLYGTPYIWTCHAHFGTGKFDTAPMTFGTMLDFMAKAGHVVTHVDHENKFVFYKAKA